MELLLTNPHSVLAALERRPGDVLEIRLPARGAGPAWKRVADRAESAGCPVRRVEGRPERQADDRRPRGRPGVGHASGRSGDAHGRVLSRQPLEPEEVLVGVPGGDIPALWLALDCLTDPRNVGAVFRSAAFFGVRGALLTRDRSAPLTAVAYDAASGGLEHVPFAEVTNLARALDLAKQAGLWILGAAEEADQDVADVDPARPWLLVVGNEETGLRRLTRERCDEVCRVSPRGPIGSLNVSVAAAVLMATLSRP